MKVAGSLLAGSGSFIGAYYTLDEANATVRKGSYAHFTALLVKGGMAGATGSAHFLTALAYSSPVLERTVGRNGLTLGLRGLHAGLEVAA